MWLIQSQANTYLNTDIMLACIDVFKYVFIWRISDNEEMLAFPSLGSAIDTREEAWLK